MAIPREDLMRLLVDIDQRVTALRDALQAPAWQRDPSNKTLYHAVCLMAARRMCEELLNDDMERLGTPDWEVILKLANLPEDWPEE
jgi:hypothetical protein